jgi:hypothetical protein
MICIGAETATNQQLFCALPGDTALGFTVAAPAAFSCVTGAGASSLDWLLLAALLGASLALTRREKAQARLPQQPRANVRSGNSGGLL